MSEPVEVRFHRLNEVLAMWGMSVERRGEKYVIKRGVHRISLVISFAEVERQIDDMIGSKAA